MKIIDAHEYENYIPIGDKVLVVLPRVEPERLEDVGGILVDQQLAVRKQPMRETVVVAVGPECKQVCKGDTIMFNKLNAAPHPFGENDLYFLPENHLVCVTKRGPTIRTPLGLMKNPAGALDEGTS